MRRNADSDPRDYRAAALDLTIALSEMAKSLETPDFHDAFWRVQRASEKCKNLKAAMIPEKADRVIVTAL